ncbi:Protein SRT-52 [Aphelenchoides avenae]|nr:Protein SRT-52 [Aphelenchus avenae]
MCWWNIPVLYNGVYGAWLFNPHAGYLDNVNELTFLQVFIISMVNALTASVYAYLQFVRVSEFLKLVAVYGWVFIHGVPGVIFLTMNRTIRVECLRILGLSRLCFKGIGDTSGTAVTSDTEQSRNNQA